ncbi:MAG: tryptophan synthase subunit alpha [Lachnospiraceae bacterium]|nr:tryptophan synthase subunit alpha [Lachnospiraceae bacterium]
MNIICYLNNGYPNFERSREIAHAYVEAGAGILEIDFPSRDPYLESALIADRMAKALENCADYDVYMEELLRLRRELPDTKMFIVIYESTIAEIGPEKFADFCCDNGFENLLMVGIDESRGIKAMMIERGLKVTCYVQFQMLEEEIATAASSNGFVYMQYKPAPGQGYVNPAYPTLKDCIRGLRDHGITAPIYCGVGVHTPEDVRVVREAGGDAAFVGSAILKLQEDLPAMKARIREFAAMCE